MAVLLECAKCYQNYAPPRGSVRSPVCPWCGAVAAVDHGPLSANGFPQLSPSRFPRRRRTLPALAWLVIGVGLGACVVLIVLILRSPDSSLIAQGSHDSTVVRGSSDPAPERDRRSPSHPVSQPTTAPQPARVILAQPNQVELVRKLVREELNRAGAPESSERPKPTTNRWLSNQPPPIGDPEDDAPPLGLTLGERMSKRIGPPPSSLDADDGVSPPAKTPPPARPKDDPAAVTALAAAGIRCDKDAESGLITRVDGAFKMTDNLMQHVAKLSGLAELKLSFSDVTDAGLAHVKDLADLRELILNQTKVTDAGLVHVEKLVKLEKLDLEKTLVTDASAKLLQSLQQLNHIDLRETRMTQVGVDRLKEKLPGAKIRH